MLADDILNRVKESIGSIDLWETMWCNDDFDYDNPFNDCKLISDVKSGATKTCLFFDDIPDFVVKIPFIGADDEWEGETEFHYANRCYPEFKDNKWDYCLTELGLFNESKAYGVSDMFAGTYYIGRINNFPIYASNRVDNCFYDYGVQSSSAESYALGSKILSSGRDYLHVDMNANLIGLFIDSYGYDKTINMLNFIKKFDIRDFHDGNLASTNDGKVKIIDYSSYNESSFL